MITIHGLFGSPFVRALRIALAEKALPWAWAPFAIGQQKQEPYLSRQPFGKIPAMEDDGFGLYETQAMLRYIERKAPAPTLIPSDLREAARMDQLLGITDCALWPTVCLPINFNRLVAPRLGMQVDEAAIEAALPHAKTTIRAIAGLMGEGPFLTGDVFSLADAAIIPHLDMLASTPEGRPLMDAQPRLTAWLALVRQRPSVIASRRPPEEVLGVAAA
jgi:glutathione S-transferase